MKALRERALCEYGYITHDARQPSSMTLAVVSKNTFDWLLALNEPWGKSLPFTLKRPDCLQLGSYVGYLQSPYGEAIEILPKTERYDHDGGEQESRRRLLKKMVSVAHNLSSREADIAALQGEHEALHEWILGRFLRGLADLLKRGLRADYHNVSEESPYLRGRLDVRKQMQQSPARLAYFHIQHDRFTPDGVENRLLATALSYVLNSTRDGDNWRLANELSARMASIETLAEPLAVWGQWRSSKLMRGYDEIKPWCQLILEGFNPQFQKGSLRGVSLLFPMERLFEKYVTHYLKKRVSHGRVIAQAASQYLVRHTPALAAQEKRWFCLKPDLLLQSATGSQVLDIKWKLLNGALNNGNDKYQISQNDFYQLLAYGTRYMAGEGNMLLIYPRHSAFQQPLPRFSFDENLHLWVVPFCLQRQQLVDGEWRAYFPMLSG